MCRDGEDERLAGILKGAGMDSPSQASPSGSQSSEDEAAAVKGEPGDGDEDDEDDDDDADDDGEDVDLDALHGAMKVADLLSSSIRNCCHRCNSMLLL